MSSAPCATLVGLAAILTWSFFSLLTLASGDVPPFQLTAITFAFGGTLGVGWLLRDGTIAALRQPVAASLNG